MKAPRLFLTCIVLAGFATLCAGCDGQQPSWGWKLATTPDDAHDFINGLGPYSEAHALGDVAATDQGFFVFYRGDLEGTSDWGWKLAPTPEDAHDFLNQSGAYSGDGKAEARLAYVGDSQLYVFYRGTSADASWGWKRATDIDDMLNFLNGAGTYGQPREGTIGGLSPGEILMFYRGGLAATSDWGWKLATTTEDAHAFLNGTGAYDQPVDDAKIFGATGGGFYIFYRRD